MKCPEDGQPLKANEAEAHTGYGCASCKGAWLPKSYVQSIKFTKEFDPKDFFSALSISKSQTSNNQNRQLQAEVLAFADTANAVGVRDCGSDRPSA